MNIRSDETGSVRRLEDGTTEEAGWITVVGQDDPEDERLMPQRMARLQRRTDEPLHLLDSSDTAELNPGFLIIAPAPWPDESSAQAMRSEFRRRSTTYVKRAWPAPDACTDATVPGPGSAGPP